jgi:hypothetical protein
MSTIERRPLRAEMDAIVDSLAVDEIRVLNYLATRLLEGQRHYGKLDLKNDHRDFVRERGEECADFIVYDAMQEVRRLVLAGK